MFLPQRSGLSYLPSNHIYWSHASKTLLASYFTHRHYSIWKHFWWTCHYEFVFGHHLLWILKQVPPISITLCWVFLMVYLAAQPRISSNYSWIPSKNRRRGISFQKWKCLEATDLILDTLTLQFFTIYKPKTTKDNYQNLIMKRMATLCYSLGKDCIGMCVLADFSFQSHLHQLNSHSFVELVFHYWASDCVLFINVKNQYYGMLNLD